MRDALKRLARQDIGRSRFDVPMKDHSWWRIGGPADMLVEPESVSHVQILRRELTRNELPHVFIGDGSNLLFDDEGVRGVVVKIGRALSQIHLNDDVVTADAGIFVPKLSRLIGLAGLTGLEHAAGIPGTLGGLVLMNGGSLRQGVGSNVDRVWAVDRLGEIVEFNQMECGFGYRSSSMQSLNLTVVRVRLKCHHGNASEIRQTNLSILRSRRRKFPRRLPNCGSVFVSDPKLYDTIGPPGKVIEECGLKGLRCGDAMIPDCHANFIVNLGNAKSIDVLSIISTVTEIVFQQIGHRLQCEVRYVSPQGNTSPAHCVLSR